MSKQSSSLQCNFNAGEWSPRLDGRADLAKYYNACRTMRNFLCYPQGPAFRRPGLEYVAPLADHSSLVRLIPFEYSDTDAYILEFTDYLIRFYRTVSGTSGLITSGGSIVTLVSPYADDDLALLQYVQTGDVMYIVHPDYPPYKLSRYSHVSWTIEKMEFVRGPFLPENDTDTTILVKTYSISAVVAGAGGTFAVSGYGDLTDYFPMGSTIKVMGMTVVANNTNWTVASTSYAAPPAFVITVTASETVIADGAPIGQIKPDISKGNLLRLVSSIPIFYADHVNSQWQLKFPEPSVSINGKFTATGNSSNLTISYGQDADLITKGVWDGVLIFEVSYDAGSTWGNLYTATGDTNVHVPFHNDTEDALVRANMNTYTSGTCKYDMVSHPYDKPGTLEIQTVLDGSNADAVVKEEFGSSNSTTKLWSEGSWSDYRGWPRGIAFYEQRVWLGGTAYEPNGIWASKSYPGGDYLNFEAGADEDDALVWTLAESQNPIEWVSAGNNSLIVGSSGGEFSLSSGSGGEPLSTINPPRAIQPGVQGSEPIQPIKTNLGHLFVERNGRRLNELAYNWEKDELAVVDMTRFSEHLTAEGIKEMAFQRRPEPVLWCVLDDGTLASLIYLREEDIVCWCSHNTQGLFESVAVIPGETEDEVFFAVNRTIGGETKRYIEKLKPWNWGDDDTDAFFVDCGYTYENTTPFTSVSGVTWLAGKTVSILADGGTHPDKVVSAGGVVTLDRSTTKAHIGLSYTSTLQPMKVAKGTLGLGSPKRIVKLVLDFYKTGYAKFGPDATHLEEIDFRQGSDLMDTAVPLYSDVIVRDPPSGFDKDGSIMIVSDKPLPLAVRTIDMLLEVS